MFIFIYSRALYGPPKTDKGNDHIVSFSLPSTFILLLSPLLLNQSLSQSFTVTISSAFFVSVLFQLSLKRLFLIYFSLFSYQYLPFFYLLLLLNFVHFGFNQWMWFHVIFSSAQFVDRAAFVLLFILRPCFSFHVSFFIPIQNDVSSSSRCRCRCCCRRRRRRRLWRSCILCYCCSFYTCVVDVNRLSSIHLYLSHLPHWKYLFFQFSDFSFFTFTFYIPSTKLWFFLFTEQTRTHLHTQIHTCKIIID